MSTQFHSSKLVGKRIESIQVSEDGVAYQEMWHNAWRDEANIFKITFDDGTTATVFSEYLAFDRTNSSEVSIDIALR